MIQEVNLNLAKLLKIKGYSWECEKFYQKYKHDKNFYLSTGIEYGSDINCMWDWNLNGGKSGTLLKTIPYPNDSDSIYYSAPIIAEVIMWLYEKHNIWICVSNVPFENHFTFEYSINNKEKCLHQYVTFESPEEAYESAIEYCLEQII